MFGEVNVTTELNRAGVGSKMTEDLEKQNPL